MKILFALRELKIEIGDEYIILQILEKISNIVPPGEL